MLINNFKSLKWLDSIYFALTNPKFLFREIEKSGNLTFVLSFLIPLILSFFYIVLFSIIKIETSFFYYKISYGWFFLFILAFLKVIIFTSIIDSIMQFLGSGGNTKKTIVLFNFALFPLLFLLPTVYIFTVLNFGIGFFFFLFFLLYSLWSILISVIGLSEMYKIDGWKALFLYVFPHLFFGIVFFLLSVSTVGLIKGAIENFFLF